MPPRPMTSNVLHSHFNSASAASFAPAFAGVTVCVGKLEAYMPHPKPLTTSTTPRMSFTSKNLSVSIGTSSCSWSQRMLNGT